MFSMIPVQLMGCFSLGQYVSKLNVKCAYAQILWDPYIETGEEEEY